MKNFEIRYDEGRKKESREGGGENRAKKGY